MLPVCLPFWALLPPGAHCGHVTCFSQRHEQKRMGHFWTVRAGARLVTRCPFVAAFLCGGIRAHLGSGTAGRTHGTSEKYLQVAQSH